MDAPLQPHMHASLRVLRKHLGLPHLSAHQGSIWIETLAVAHNNPEAQRVVDQLEEITGLTIAELAEETKKW